MTRLAALRGAIGIGLGLYLAGSLVAAPEPTATPSGAIKCPPGMVCLPQAVYQHEIESASACLEALQVCRAKGAGKWGWCAGPSGSVLLEPLKLEDGGVSWDWHAGFGASVVWGRRF